MLRATAASLNLESLGHFSSIFPALAWLITPFSSLVSPTRSRCFLLLLGLRSTNAALVVVGACRDFTWLCLQKKIAMVWVQILVRIA